MTTTTDPLVREREAAAGAARGRWLMLIVLLAGQFMALLDVTIVNVAMPTIGRTLHATGAELQLVVKAVCSRTTVRTSIIEPGRMARREPRQCHIAVVGTTTESHRRGSGPGSAVLLCRECQVGSSRLKRVQPFGRRFAEAAVTGEASGFRGCSGSG